MVHLTQEELKNLAENYYIQAKKILEDKELGRVEFINEDEVYQLLYDLSNDFYASVLGEL